MKKPKISVKKIKAIKIGDIAARTQKMKLAVFGATSVFKDPPPHTEVDVDTIVTTFLKKESEYETGGILQKPAFTTAKSDIYGCVLSFAPYVDKAANGDLAILNLSTLPTNMDDVDYGALIAAGAKADGITAKQGISKQIVTDCKAFGEGVNYFVVLSEGAPLPADFSISNTGQTSVPPVNRIIMGITTTRTKKFDNLLPATVYYVYYVLWIGFVVGLLSDGIPVVTSV